MAVLDLQSAYDRVRRDKLLQLCAQHLPPDLLGMVQSLLVATAVTTQGQKDGTSATITRGVPQGDVPSPALFNMFLDTLLHRLDHVPRHLSTAPANGYADDVLLLAFSVEGLHWLLKEATDWASETASSTTNQTDHSP